MVCKSHECIALLSFMCYLMTSCTLYHFLSPRDEYDQITTTKGRERSIRKRTRRKGRWRRLFLLLKTSFEKQLIVHLYCYNSKLTVQIYCGISPYMYCQKRNVPKKWLGVRRLHTQMVLFSKNQHLRTHTLTLHDYYTHMKMTIGWCTDRNSALSLVMCIYTLVIVIVDQLKWH